MATQMIIRVEPSLKNKVSKLAKAEGKNLSELVRELLEKYTKEVYKIIHSLSVNNVSSANYLYLKKYVLTLCVLYSPFAPHMSEEVWHRLGGERRVAQAKWPTC